MPRDSGTGTIGRRHAVLIGMSAYPRAPELLPLKCPPRDVAALKRVFSDSEPCRFDEVTAVVDVELQQVRETIHAAFKKAEPEDLLLFYFSGHGKPRQAGNELYLCTRSTTIELLEATAFGLEELNQVISSNRVARVVIVLDCCFSGLAHAAIKSDLESLLKTSLGGGRGKYLLTSSNRLETTIENEREECSPFTKWLVEGLETWAADLNHDDIITVQELFQYAENGLKDDSPAQHPCCWGFDVSGGDFVLARRRSGQRTAAPASEPVHLEYFDAVRARWHQGKIIPFIGAGTYTGSVLNHFALSSSLARGTGLKVGTQESLAATAEYVERFREGQRPDEERGRRELRDAFSEVLRQQTQDVNPPTTHELICGLTPPWLVVSATYDMVLEDRLAAKGVPHVIVSHILRSRDSKNNGKILLVRRGPNPSAEVCLADALPLEVDERTHELTDCVIYKILGSPFLDELADPELSLDTLVLTEADHTTFLGLLEHQYTQVPTCFTLPFKQRDLLYLGYSLDLWHYRLLVQLKVFHGASFAVRQPTSQMEALCWDRLGADVIHSDPEEFSKMMLATRVGTSNAART